MLNRNDKILQKDSDLQKCWAIIDNLEPCEVYNIEKITENRRDIFIQCVKQRIDTLNDCEFNPDYTKIRKLSDFCTFV
jgi:hypothetical protein